ncbi:MAG: 2-C-methyl-D-erythritol 4-phosphate cytidylyltransferase [Clostridia bacterium]|jgi:2-C-methyl-D-erythritol 4-phosphate cytidylyltransferase|nr:2-C-methyl-D-erythritol 4-phosphate cytidylyltransferase [Clostridia bacterium]
MTVAIVIAGGVGSRMGADIPKQFVLVDGKPVIFDTIEGWEKYVLLSKGRLTEAR